MNMQIFFNNFVLDILHKLYVLAETIYEKVLMQRRIAYFDVCPISVLQYPDCRTKTLRMGGLCIT